jgi:hypothetical protein
VGAQCSGTGAAEPNSEEGGCTDRRQRARAHREGKEISSADALRLFHSFLACVTFLGPRSHNARDLKLAR